MSHHILILDEVDDDLREWMLEQPAEAREKLWQLELLDLIRVRKAKWVEKGKLNDERDYARLCATVILNDGDAIRERYGLPAAETH